MKAKQISNDWGSALNADIGQRVVSEDHLDCIACTSTTFEPVTKCCSFWPFLANYQVQQLLESYPETVESWLNTFATVVLPLGVFPSREFVKNHQSSPNQQRCPFLTTKSLCGIWSFRPSRCATFFCQSKYRESGLAFWEAMDELGAYFEQGLAQAFMIEAGFEWREVEAQRQLLSPDADSGKSRQKLWAHWFGRELDFFAKAAQWRRRLSQEEVATLLGPKWNELQAEAVRLHDLTSWNQRL